MWSRLCVGLKIRLFAAAKRGRIGKRVNCKGANFSPHRGEKYRRRYQVMRDVFRFAENELFQFINVYFVTRLKLRM